MRWVPKSIPVLALAIASYFTLYFGMDALRILLSPVYGLDQPIFGSMAQGISRHVALGALSAFQVAAFMGAIKLAIAALFAIYLASRLRSWLGRETEHEIMDAAVVLIVIVTVMAATPALLEGDMDLLAQYRLPLWLSGLMATLSMIERAIADGVLDFSTPEFRRAIPGADFALPPRRCGVSSQRWDALRRSANMDLETAVTIKPLRISRLRR
jgi:hypothetical protein